MEEGRRRFVPKRERIPSRRRQAKQIEALQSSVLRWNNIVSFVGVMAFATFVAFIAWNSVQQATINAANKDIDDLENCTEQFCADPNFLYNAVEELSDNITDVNDTLNQVNKTLTDHIQEISNMTVNGSVVDGLVVKVDELDNCTAQFCADPDQLYNDVDSLNNTVSQLDGDISDLNSTINDLLNCTSQFCANPNQLYDDIDSLNNTLTQVSTDLNDVESDVNVLNGSVAQLNNCTSQFCADPNQLYDDIDSLNDTLIQVSTDLDDVESDISVLNGSVTQLNNCTSQFCADPNQLYDDIDYLNTTIQSIINQDLVTISDSGGGQSLLSNGTGPNYELFQIVEGNGIFFDNSANGGTGISISQDTIGATRSTAVGANGITWIPTTLFGVRTGPVFGNYPFVPDLTQNSLCQSHFVRKGKMVHLFTVCTFIAAGGSIDLVESPNNGAAAFSPYYAEFRQCIVNSAWDEELDASNFPSPAGVAHLQCGQTSGGIDIYEPCGEFVARNVAGPCLNFAGRIPDECIDNNTPQPCRLVTIAAYEALTPLSDFVCC